MRISQTALIVAALRLAFAQSPQPAAAPTAELLRNAGKFHALLIGIDDYSSLPHLQNAVNDATSLEAELRDKYGFSTRLLTNRQATREGILKALNDYRSILHDDDNLLIYYAGHGKTDRESNESYWLPSGSEADASDRWISTDDITISLRVMPARHVLVISDSALGGTLVRGSTADVGPSDYAESLAILQRRRSRTVIAAGADEPVLDGAGNSHSVFAGAILHGLRVLEGTAFSADSLYSWYVRDLVAGISNEVPYYSGLRNSGHDGGEFVFLGTGLAQSNSPATPKTLDLAAQEEIAFWEKVDAADPDSLRLYLGRYPGGRFADLANLSLNRISRPVPRDLPARGVSLPDARDRQVDPGLRVALVIGVDRYPENSGFSQLNFAHNDAQDLSNELSAQGYHVKTLTNEDTRGSAVLEALYDMLHAPGPAPGTLLFAFSGHGAQEDGVQYLATWDTKLRLLKAGTGLSIQKIEEILNESPVTRKVMLIDACRNDPAARGEGSAIEAFDEMQRAPSGIGILNAAAPKSYSYEDATLSHGVFTYYVLKALGGDAPHPTGYVYLDFHDLFTYDGKWTRIQSALAGCRSPTAVSPDRAGDFVLTGPFSNQ